MLNAKSKQARAASLRRLIKEGCKVGNRQGYVQIFKNNTLRHETVKFQVAYLLMKAEFSVWTEVSFKTGGRCDICAISQTGVGYIIEILESEKETDCLLKGSKYPEEFGSIVMVKTKEFDPDTWVL